MRWTGRRRSRNIEDRRGKRVSRGFVGGGLGTLVILLVALYFGADPTFLLEQLQQAPRTPGGSIPGPRPPEENRLADFVSVVVADTEDTWNALFSASGLNYEEPKLVLFTDIVQSACGMASAAVGPFYCPKDSKVYIDLGFYRTLRERFRAPGDFAQAYVIAHEIGHHIQNLLGISERVQKARQRVGRREGNALSVMQELQADCLAGVWAHHADRARQILEEGDVEEALNAASAIGDDRLQQQSQGRVVPDTFTHGTSEQRVRWFRKGLATGETDSCDTFSAGLDS